MENIKEIITQLDKLNPEWQKEIRQSINNEQAIDSEIVQLFNSLCKCILDEIKTQKETQGIYDVLGDDGKWIIKYIEPSIKAFNAFNCVRELNNQEAEKLMDYLYDNVIIFYDPNFSSAYKQLGMNSQEEFVELAKNLDALTRYYVTRQFSQKAIVEDISDDLKLEENICTYMSQKIHDNFSIIQNALILEKLTTMEK